MAPGVGRALVGAGLAREEEVTLWVFAQTGRARRFCAALGFLEEGAEAIDPVAGVLEVRMRRTAGD